MGYSPEFETLVGKLMLDTSFREMVMDPASREAALESIGISDPAGVAAEIQAYLDEDGNPDLLYQLLESFDSDVHAFMG